MARHQEDDAVRVALFNAAVDRGLTCFDTAPLYDFGAAERQLGMAFGDDERIQVFSKVGLRWDDDAQGEEHFRFVDAQGVDRVVRRDSRPESVRWEVEQSLKRLNRSSLDLVQIHQPDLRTPLDETMSALLDLHAEGKVKHIGVSNFSIAQIIEAQRALGSIPLASLQPAYNLLNREIEDKILALCRHHNIAVISYSPLAEGQLAKLPNPQLPEKAAAAASAVLIPIAEKYGVGPAAIALAWVSAQEGITAPICGASSVAQLDALVQSMKLELSTQDLQALSTHFSPSRLQTAPQRLKRLIKKPLRKIRRVLGV